MMMKAPEDVFRSILNSLTDVPVKVDSKKACYLLNDYFEKGISASGIKVSPNVTKYQIFHHTKDSRHRRNGLPENG